MITHLLKSINWIDVALVVLFVRMIFVGIKNGFISEFFKCLGVVVAVFVSLHYYSVLAVWVAQKTKITWDLWDFIMFAGLWFAIAIFFKYVRETILILFNIEAKHQGFDKYASGIVAVGRGILVCSLTIFLLLLTHKDYLMKMTLHSYSYKIAGHAAVNTYGYLYNNLIDKLCPGEHYNTAVAEVLHPAG
jgi:uncharacterized membrane protein required for colicin V production